MKKIYSVIIASVLIFMLAVGLTSCGGQLVEKVDKTNSDYHLKYYRTTDELCYTVAGIESYNTTDIVIPNSFNGLPVKSIGWCAFADCDFITSVTIPDSITSIDPGAFSGCTNLKFNEYDNAYYLGNEENPYHALIKAKDYSITSCTINENTKVVAANAFSDCRSLKDIDFTENCKLKEISRRMFAGCTSLTSIEIPEGIKKIDSSAFENCSNLTNIEIPEGIKWIGHGSFKGCTSLTSIEIPSSVTVIDVFAFEDCDKLVEVINKSSLNITKGSEDYGYVAYNALEIHSGMSKIVNIGDYQFYTCDGVNYLVNYVGEDAELVLPEDYNGENYEIYKRAFCKTIKNPYSHHTFLFDSNLTSIEIPASVTGIGNGAFTGCYKLVEVINKSSLDITKGSSDYGYVAYNALEVHSGESKIVDIDDYRFYTYEGVNYLLGYVGSDSELILPENYNEENYEIYKRAFYERDDIMSVEIPASVTGIGSDAFDYCHNLASISFGDNSQLQTIDELTFSYLSSLTSVRFGNNSQLQSIGSSAFSNCSALASIEIPESVTSIGSYAFSSCDALTSIEIPASVTSIGSSAFSGCFKLVEVINKSSFDITKGSEEYGDVAYYALEVHSGESKIVNKDDYLFYTYEGVNYLLGYVGNDSELILPENYNEENYEIYKLAFYERDDIKSVEMPASVISIDPGAFSGCTNLKFNEYDNAYYLGNEENPYHALIKAKDYSINSCAINENTKVIADSAFNNCKELTSIEIPASVTSIDSDAFEDCYKLVEVINKSSLDITKGSSDYGYVAYNALEVHSGESKIVNIDDYLFYTYEGVNYLVNYVGEDTKLILPKDYNGENYEIYKYALSFFYRDDIISIKIPASVTGIGDYAFSGCDKLESIKIPANVAYIGYGAFNGCNSLTSVKFADTTDWYETKDSSYTGGTQIDVTDSSRNTINFCHNYRGYYWYKR